MLDSRCVLKIEMRDVTDELNVRIRKQESKSAFGFWLKQSDDVTLSDLDRACLCRGRESSLRCLLHMGEEMLTRTLVFSRGV